MSDTRILVLVGSRRADSLNRRIAETLQAQAPDGVVIEIAENLAELPFYNEDLDGDSVPAAAAALRERVAAADRVRAVPPEYTAPMPAVLHHPLHRPPLTPRPTPTSSATARAGCQQTNSELNALPADMPDSRNGAGASSGCLALAANRVIASRNACPLPCETLTYSSMNP